METRSTIRLLSLSALIVVSGWAGWRPGPNPSAFARPQATITITQPDGVGDVVGEGDDFATTVLGDPWDMDQPTDILALHGLPGATISNGLLNYTAEILGSQVPLLLPGVLGAMDVGKVGANYPINTDHYHWLSFRMNQPAGPIQIKWYYDKTYSTWGGTDSLPVTPGWHTYVIDLETVSKVAGSWQGQVQGLHLVSLASSGTPVSVDWVRLTANNPIGNDLDVAWSGLSPVGATVDFYLDFDHAGCDDVLIHTEYAASATGSFAWRQPARGIASPTNVAPGDYYVCARVNGQVAGYSTGTLTVNQAPIVRFTQPSFNSGDDYATDTGNPWDMSDVTDVRKVENGSYMVNSGILAVTVPASNGDVQVYLNVPTAIDSGRYYYLTYRLWFDYDYDWVDVGQVARVFWGRKPNIETVSSLIYDFPGWQTYSLDLRSADLVSGPAWGTADWTMFRMDPIANNTGQTVTFYIDDVKLTSDERADEFADIKWQVTDPDTAVTTLALYYDTDQSGLNGTHIATLTLTDGQQAGLTLSTTDACPSLKASQELSNTIFLPLVNRNWYPPCTGACYTWNTSSVVSGAYHLYACVNDGYNQLCRYGERPLYISHWKDR